METIYSLTRFVVESGREGTRSDWGPEASPGSGRVTGSPQGNGQSSDMRGSPVRCVSFVVHPRGSY